MLNSTLMCLKKKNAVDIQHWHMMVKCLYMTVNVLWLIRVMGWRWAAVVFWDNLFFRSYETVYVCVIISVGPADWVANHPCELHRAVVLLDTVAITMHGGSIYWVWSGLTSVCFQNTPITQSQEVDSFHLLSFIWQSVDSFHLLLFIWQSVDSFHLLFIWQSVDSFHLLSFIWQSVDSFHLLLFIGQSVDSFHLLLYIWQFSFIISYLTVCGQFSFIISYLRVCCLGFILNICACLVFC